MKRCYSLHDFVQTLHPLAIEAVAEEFGARWWRRDIKALARAIAYHEILTAAESDDDALDMFWHGEDDPSPWENPLHQIAA